MEVMTWVCQSLITWTPTRVGPPLSAQILDLSDFWGKTLDLRKISDFWEKMLDLRSKVWVRNNRHFICGYFKGNRLIPYLKPQNFRLRRAKFINARLLYYHN